MDKMKENKMKDFVLHITIFSGCVLWLLVVLVIGGFYQVGWHRVGSIQETVINQVNQEEATKQVAAQMDERAAERVQEKHRH